MAAQTNNDAKSAVEDVVENENDTILEDTAEEESDWISNVKKPVENLVLQLD